MNTKINIRTGSLIAVLALMATISWAQGGPGNERGLGQGCGQGEACTMAFDSPMDERAFIEKKLAVAIEDEYHAKAVYADVLEKFGDVRPFSNIILAEQRHIEALERLYDKYGLEVPEDPFADVTFEFASLEAAVQASVDAEIANADLYDELLVDVTDPDVVTVFGKLQWASRERHLPAFERYLENGGQGGPGNGKGRGRRGGGGGKRQE